MDHRHLLPNEIDLLLDGDAGFGLAPLKAHVRACESCQAQLTAARQVVLLLDELPHLAPTPRFADRVLADVQIFEPWHVTLRDSVLHYVPSSRPARALAATGAFVSALAVSVAFVMLLGRSDLLLFGWQFVVNRSRALAVDVLGGVVSAIFGTSATASLAATTSGAIAVAAGIFLASIVLAALLLRALTSAHRRQRP